MNNITEYVANRTMALTGKNTCLSFVRLVWRDKVALVMFNNLSNKIDNILFDPVLQEDDFNTIENMVRMFLN